VRTAKQRAHTLFSPWSFRGGGTAGDEEQGFEGLELSLEESP